MAASKIAAPTVVTNVRVCHKAWPIPEMCHRGWTIPEMCHLGWAIPEMCHRAHLMQKSVTPHLLIHKCVTVMCGSNMAFRSAPAVLTHPDVTLSIEENAPLPHIRDFFSLITRWNEST